MKRTLSGIEKEELPWEPNLLAASKETMFSEI